MEKLGLKTLKLQILNKTPTDIKIKLIIVVNKKAIPVNLTEISESFFKLIANSAFNNC